MGARICTISAIMKIGTYLLSRRIRKNPFGPINHQMNRKSRSWASTPCDRSSRSTQAWSAYSRLARFFAILIWRVLDPRYAVLRKIPPCWRIKSKSLAPALLLLLGLSPARSETPEQWIELGARMHGAFGAFIPVWNKLDPAARFDAGMAAQHLFQSEPAPWMLQPAHRQTTNIPPFGFQMPKFHSFHNVL